MTPDLPVRIEHFRSLMKEAGVEEVVEESLRMFVGGAPERHRRLEEAVHGADAEAVEAEAHALRSAALTIWAVDLARALEEMEAAGEGADLEKARLLLGPVAHEVRRAVTYLEEQLGQ